MKIEIDGTDTLTPEMISKLVSTLQKATTLKSDEIVAEIQSILQITDISNVQFEVEYLNGHDFEMDKEYKHDENIQDNENDHEDDQQKTEDVNNN